MHDTAAHLVDSVLPHAPVRQWVLSIPRPLRFLLARDSKLITKFTDIFVSEVFRHLRRQAGIRRKSEGEGGAVTGVQRFGGAMNLNVHLHSLVLDGVYRGGSFKRAKAPTREELSRVLTRTRSRALAFLRKEGYAVDPEEGESGEEMSVQGVIQAASIREWIGLSDEARRVRVLGEEEKCAGAGDEKPFTVRTRDGWNLHAAVRIRAGDRKGLEQLCRYVLRPPFSEDRMTELPDGRVAYEFRRERVGGSTHVVLTPVELLEKLAALVPPPRSHLVRYHGVVAPHAKRRKSVVPRGASLRDAGRCDEGVGGGRKKVRRSRAPWAELMRRSMGLEVLTCPQCRNLMEPIAVIKKAETISRILRAIGLPDEAPSLAPARPPPQLRFEFVQDGDVIFE